MMNKNELISYLASYNASISYAIDEICSKHTEYKDILFSYLREIISEEQIQHTINKDWDFKGYGKISDELNTTEHAILWIGKEIFPILIAKHRIENLKKSFEISRPKPYDHPDLSEIEIDENNLVDINQFNINRSGSISIGSTFFTIMQSLQCSNHSMYWVVRRILELKNYNKIKVRLDPFIFSSIDGYRAPAYKMFVYGKPPEIDKIHLIKNEVHVQWMPDNNIESEIKITDAVWQNRDNEIHFICEEVPKDECINYRGSRYFHSIYNIHKKFFVHIDGAIRLYENNEIEQRTNTHVRKIGKIGKRIKLFQIDQPIPLNQWCNIAASFFVWNKDVEKYFGYRN